MSDTVFLLITTYGSIVIMVSAYLSCLFLPIPTSLMMLAGGAFVATGDLDLTMVVASAFVGAVLGDQTGYFLGRYGGAPLADRLAKSPSRKAVLKRARLMVDRWGAVGVFFSTWAVAPLGPWVNVIAGTTGLAWLRFTVADVLGEAIWVTVYVGLGFAFASQIDTVATVLSNVVGLLAGLALVIGCAIWIRVALKARRKTALTSSATA